MILIIEGPQKVGKTTISKYLIEEFGFDYYDPDLFFGIDPREVIPSGVDNFRLWSQTLQVSTAGILTYLHDNTTNLIIDRFHLSEAVYGKINRSYETDDFYSNIDRLLSSSSCPIRLLYCSDHVDNIIERCYQAGINDDQRYIVTEFNRRYDQSLLPKLRVNVKDQIQEILHFVGIDEFDEDKFQQMLEFNGKVQI